MVLDVDYEFLLKAVRGCSGVISCLGHSSNIFMPSRSFVTDTVVRICEAIKKDDY